MDWRIEIIILLYCLYIVHVSKLPIFDMGNLPCWPQDQASVSEDNVKLINLSLCFTLRRGFWTMMVVNRAYRERKAVRFC